MADASVNVFSPTNWDHLPVELLEMIFGYFSYPTQSRFLLSLRGVSKHWGSEANSAAEKQILKNLTEWHPSINMGLLMTRSSLQLILKDNGEDDGAGIGVNYPDGTKINFLENRNPFPGNSLWLKSYGLGWENMPSLFQTHGNYLTSLTLQGFNDTSPLELYTVLEGTPNLKVFTLESIKKGNKSGTEFMSQDKVSPCPKLTHFRMCCNDDIAGFGFEQFFVKLFAPSLISLEVDGSDLLPFTQENYPVAGSFKNLARLKIIYATKQFVHETGVESEELCLPFTLEYLAIIHPKDNVAMSELTRFLGRFSNSLVELFLVSNFADFFTNPKTFRVQAEDDEDRVVWFPNLKKLSIANVNCEPVRRLVMEYFRPGLPNMEVLQWLNFGRSQQTIMERPWVAESISRRMNLWETSPRLKIIEIYCDSTESLASPPKYTFTQERKYTLDDYDEESDIDLVDLDSESLSDGEMPNLPAMI